MMNKTQPTYTEEFKRNAVRLVETSGKPKTQIARDLGLSAKTIRRYLATEVFPEHRPRTM
jgi:transposase-like protein